MSNTTKTTSKTFTWNVKSIDIDYNSTYSRYPEATAHIDILGTPGSTASVMELHRDLQNRLSGKPTSIPEIKNVIFNPPATIILWSDNTKTVVKCQEGDTYDPEHGLAMAIVKKMYGNTGKYCEIFKKWIKEEEEECPEIPNISYEEAIKLVKKQVDDLRGKILNNLYGAPKKETGWIATTNKLPCTKGDYLVYDTFTGSSYVYEYDNSSLNDVIYWQRHITHWMPVPAAPGATKGE